MVVSFAGRSCRAPRLLVVPLPATAEEFLCSHRGDAREGRLGEWIRQRAAAAEELLQHVRLLFVHLRRDAREDRWVLLRLLAEARLVQPRHVERVLLRLALEELRELRPLVRRQPGERLLGGLPVLLRRQLGRNLAVAVGRLLVGDALPRLARLIAVHEVVELFVLFAAADDVLKHVHESFSRASSVARRTRGRAPEPVKWRRLAVDARVVRAERGSAR